MPSLQALHAAILDQTGERSAQSPVSIRFFGVAVDFLPSIHGFRRRTMNMASIVDVAMAVAGAIVTNKTEGFPSCLDQRQTARKVICVVHVLSQINAIPNTVIGFSNVITLPVATRFFFPTRIRIIHPFCNRTVRIEVII